MSIDISLHCSHCGADFNNNTLEENLELIENCTNCIADLALKGKWTGTAHKIIVKSIEKYGFETIKYTYEKLKFSKI